MRKRFFGGMIAVATAMAAVALLPASAVAQAPTSNEKTWNPPRTPDGQPDIQGFWANQGRRLATYNTVCGDSRADLARREVARVLLE
jgi:hypothetical protein